MNRGVLAVLSLGHLAVDITAGALPATLPFLQQKFALSYFWLGLIMMSSGLGSSLLQPLFGVVSDVMRTRYFLPLGVLAALAAFSAIGIARSYPAIIMLVTLAAVGSAMYHPEGNKSAYAVSGIATRTSGMSYFSVGGNIGVALGPLIITAIIAAQGLQGTRLLLVPAVVIAALVAIVLPAISRAHVSNKKQRFAQPRSGAVPLLALLVLAAGLRSMAYSGVLTFVPLYAVNVLHKSPTGNGLLLFVFLAGGVMGTIVGGHLADRFGTQRILTGSLAFAPLSLALYLTSSGLAAWIGLALSGASLIGTFATAVVLGQALLPNRLAFVSALLIGMTSGFGALGVAALGKLADVMGLHIVLWSLVFVALCAFIFALVLPAVHTISVQSTSRAITGQHEA